MSRSPARALAIALIAGTALSACGLKQDVKDKLAQGTIDQGVGLPGGSTGGVGDLTSGTTGTGPAGATGTTGTGVGTGGSTGVGTSGTTTGGSSTGSTGAGATGATGGTTGGGSGTVTGIDFKNKKIRIALHGPLTGAGVPQSSFTSGTPKYWANHRLSNGFTVDAIAVDDKYNAADALRACNKYADTHFLIIGGAGTDQISACAQSPKLRRLHVPYLSAGVTEAGLSGISSYFATSLTYREQSALLVRLAKDRGYFGKKWAMIITGTPNFADARQSMVSELQRAGAKGSSGAFNPSRDVFLTDKAPSNCSSYVSPILSGRYEVIYFLGQPSFFAQCVGAFGDSPHHIYTGPGPSFGINSVINLACKSNANYEGYYLHPTPSWNQRQKYGAPSDLVDDIEVGIWGAMQQLHESLDKVLARGPLTRESFIEASQNASLRGGVFAPTVFTPTDHFGGTAAYANAALCTQTGPPGSPPGISNTIGTYRK